MMFCTIKKDEKTWTYLNKYIDYFENKKNWTNEFVQDLIENFISDINSMAKTKLTIIFQSSANILILMEY